MGCQGSVPVREAEPCEVALCPPFHESYQILNMLGKGAFAKVYLAKQTMLDCPVAVKIIDLRRSGDKVNARSRQLVEAEIAILRRVADRDHVVKYLAHYVEGCFAYIVMERCELTLLQALEQQTDISEQSFKRVFTEMLRALSALHALRVVHRDVKPDNFMCAGPNSMVKVCDFGLAEVLPPVGRPDLKGVYGTAPFMSPEMLRMHGYGEKTDVWSLGVIAYVLMLGQFPYQPTENTGKGMKAIISAGDPAPTFEPKVNSRAGRSNGSTVVSPDARRFLRALLSRDPARRPAATEALQHAWLQSPAAGNQSLREMLLAAKRAGAFDTRTRQEPGNGLCLALAAEQAKYHRTDDFAEISHVISVSTTSTTASTVSQRRSGQNASHDKEQVYGVAEPQALSSWSSIVIGRGA